MLMMFGVGLHFSLEDLLAVRRDRHPRRGGADRRRHGAGRRHRTRVGLEHRRRDRLRPRAVRREHGRAAARAGSRGVLQSVNGRIAVGWLVVEDLVVVLVLVLLPALAGVLGGTAPIATDGTGSVGWTARGDPRQGCCVCRAHARRGTPAPPQAAVAGRAHRLARAVYPGGDLRGGRRGLRIRRGCSASPSRSAPSSPA